MIGARAMALAFFASTLLAALPVHADGGLADIFGDKFDPSKDSRDGPQTEAPEPDRPQPALPLPKRPVVMKPDLASIDESIRRKQSLGWDDMQPVDSAAAAAERLKALEARRAQLENAFDDRARAQAELLARQADAVERKWRPLVDAVTDGKDRGIPEWKAINDHIRSASIPLPVPPRVPPTADTIDQLLGMPEESPPAVPLKPTDLSDLIEAISNHDKPRSLPPPIWLSLTDELKADIDAVRVAASQMKRDLEERRAKALAPVDQALEAARRSLDLIGQVDDELPEWMRKQMAWRLHQAELAELKRLRKDMADLVDVRAMPEITERVPLYLNPLDPAGSVLSISEYFGSEGGEASAPEANAFDDIDAEGLPSLYPSDTVLDDSKVHYGRLVDANIARYGAARDDLRDQLARLEQTVTESDRQQLIDRVAERRHRDWLEGRTDLRALRDRQEWAKNTWREMVRTRPTRVAEERKKIEQSMASVEERLIQEYRRRDEMR